MNHLTDQRQGISLMGKEKCEMLSDQRRERLDISRLVPEAQAIVHAAATVYLHHLGQWCMGVLVHGSALKGDYIPGCSDIDFQLYLEPAAFTQKGQLPLEVCLALQRDLAQIEPFPFQYIQGHALPPSPSCRGWDTSHPRSDGGGAASVGENCLGETRSADGLSD